MPIILVSMIELGFVATEQDARHSFDSLPFIECPRMDTRPSQFPPS